MSTKYIGPNFNESIRNIDQGTVPTMGLPMNYYSNYFDGATYISTSYISQYELRQKIFTLEAWVYTGTGSVRYLMTQNSESAGWGWRINSDNTMTYYQVGGDSITSTVAISTNAWTHIAITRGLSTARCFINGVLDNSGIVSRFTGTSAVGVDPRIGHDPVSNLYFSGFISNLRLTLDVENYSGNFTPPSQPYNLYNNSVAYDDIFLLTCQNLTPVDISKQRSQWTATGTFTPSTRIPFQYPGISQSAQNKYLTLLQRGVSAGSRISDSGGNAVVSTYNVLYTTSWSYSGGVLALNGDIHFVPTGAAVGQKISANGTISTYSLAYTTYSAYYGGVLAPNGDIHFVPTEASVGQKISPSGVVSTYSLIYTQGGYREGAVSANGDIHFIPRTAPVGQKVSPTGVVSTYSLIVTTSFTYWGGVRALNGDIHCAPAETLIGQKISPNGVVSTYSLLYSVTNAYAGGVLAPNGDVHFIPRSAAVGQKISPSGVVSTYSLVYTGSAAYQGGVLASNGDIHFVPSNAVVGQKISADGVVSTYSLAATGLFHLGGVLGPNGDIHFVLGFSSVGQKISVDSGYLLPIIV